MAVPCMSEYDDMPISIIQLRGIGEVEWQILK